MGIERRLSHDRCERAAFRRDPDIAALAAAQFGVVTTADLAALGVGRMSISRRRRRGHLHQLYPGVWAVGHAEPPWEGWLLAAVMACGPGAFLSHYSGNELFGFVDRVDGMPHVTVTTGSHRTPRGIHVHRTQFLDPIDRRERCGIPVTSAARCLLDLASMVDAQRTRRAIRRALGQGKVTIRQLGMVLERYPGRRGSATLKAAVRLGAAPTNSEKESDVLDIVLAGGFERPDVNKGLRVAGRWVVPDLRWPRQRLTVEIDSKAWHTDPLARADDRGRQALLEAMGDRVLRVDWLDAVLAPSKFAEALIRAGAPWRKAAESRQG
jgi:hypothetical protein